MRVHKHSCGVFMFMHVFEKYFIKATELCFHVYKALFKHLVGWENSQKINKPLTASSICIIVSNSPNLSRVCM